MEKVIIIFGIIYIIGILIFLCSIVEKSFLVSIIPFIIVSGLGIAGVGWFMILG